MEFQHPKWYRITFLCFSFFILLFPSSLIFFGLGLLSDYKNERDSYLYGGLISFFILGLTIEMFARHILSSVAITRKALIIRPGGIFLWFFTMSKRYSFSDCLLYIFLENGEPVMVDIYNIDKQIQAHIYNPRIRQVLLQMAEHQYVPNFHVGELNSAQTA